MRTPLVPTSFTASTMLSTRLGSMNEAELTSFSRSAVSEGSTLISRAMAEISLSWSAIEALQVDDVVGELGEGLDLLHDRLREGLELLEVHVGERDRDARHRLAVLGVDVEALLREADLLHHQHEDDDAEAGALGVVEHRGEGLLERGEGPRAREPVEDADLLLAGDLHVVAHRDREGLVPGLEHHLHVEPQLLLLLEVVLDVVERLGLERLHPELVVLLVVEVEPLLEEEHALGVRLLRVDGQLAQAVGQRLLQLLLAELGQERLEDLVEVDLGLVREGVGLVREGDGVVRCPFDLGEVNLGGHEPPGVP